MKYFENEADEDARLATKLKDMIHEDVDKWENLLEKVGACTDNKSTNVKTSYELLMLLLTHPNLPESIN
jgi:hypothetical protein